MSDSRLRPVLSSVLSAAVVAAIAHVVTMLSFFVGASPNPAVLGEISNFFVLSTLVAFVLVAIFALVGALRRWYTALIAGLVSGVLAALVGTGAQTLAQGHALDGSVIGYLFTTLVSINLIFVLTVTIATVTVGRRMQRTMVTKTVEAVPTSHTVLVRRPASSLAEGEVTHIERSEIDLDLAEEQWEAYVAALIGAGWKPVEIEVADKLPDSVFIEDTVVLFGNHAVITSPGAESRRGETAAVEAAVRDLGVDVTTIALPGTLDGGDVLKIGTTVYVGRGGRTNTDGIRQLRHILAPLGYNVVAVPVTKALHLKSAVTALPDGTVIGYPPIVDDPSIFDRFLAVPEEQGSHVVVLSSDTVLMSSAAPQSAALIESLGYRVIAVDISEFEKLEGCVTCLSVRIR